VDWITIALLILGGLIGLYLLRILILKPLKFIFKLLIWIVIGVLLVILFNNAVSSFSSEGIHISL